MREIKFRAWHEQDKEMVYFKNEKLVKDVHQMQHLANLINGQYGDVLMQLTGLKDKNGVEIYDGDILKGSSKVFGATLGTLELSIYEDCECYMHENHYGWNVCGIPFKDLVDDGLIVIGNIYENPELLTNK